MLCMYIHLCDRALENSCWWCWCPFLVGSRKAPRRTREASLSFPRFQITPRAAPFSSRPLPWDARFKRAPSASRRAKQQRDSGSRLLMLPAVGASFWTGGQAKSALEAGGRGGHRRRLVNSEQAGGGRGLFAQTPPPLLPAAAAFPQSSSPAARLELLRLLSRLAGWLAGCFPDRPGASGALSVRSVASLLLQKGRSPPSPRL